MDVFSKEKRSEIMRKITGRDTAPELAVRSVLHASGYRFRLNRMDLIGKPDVVLPRHRTVIFVHGCFWHSHTCKDGRRPSSNRGYWDEKLERNKKRDRKCVRELKKAGWNVLVVWGCQAKNRKKLEMQLQRQLSMLNPSQP